MKNSGYVAIGHLIGGKSKEEIVKTLKHFISVMFKALDDNMINKVDFEWNLDKFMEKMPKGKKYINLIYESTQKTSMAFLKFCNKS